MNIYITGWRESFHNVYVPWITTMYTLNILLFFFSIIPWQAEEEKGMRANLSGDLMPHFQTWLNKATWKLSFSQRLLFFNSPQKQGVEVLNAEWHLANWVAPALRVKGFLGKASVYPNP